MSNIVCPTCEGNGEIELQPEGVETWDKYCGDKDLWLAFSHASEDIGDKTGHKGYRKRAKGLWGPYYKIVSFYRNDTGFSLNLERGSYPCLSSADIQKHFKFISRQTSEPIEFYFKK